MNTTSKENIVILGAAESGVGAAILAAEKGCSVFVSDSGRVKPRYAEILDREGIEWEQGGHTPERVLSATAIIKSPGIPPTAPLVAEACRRGIPILSEIEFAARYTDAKMICITGSNGKTTTTLLTYHILRRAGLNVGLAGNVGRSLALQVAREPKDCYVIELSSFQLENMYDFKANIAVILNITPDHMDRYDHKMENYVGAKFRILQNQTPSEAFIYWEDDPVITRQIERMGNISAHCYPFGIHHSGEGASLEDDERVMVFNTGDRELRMPVAQLSLSGLHNIYNSMAAGLSACLMDVRDDVIRRALSDFEGVEHRLERIRTTSDGVLWINDSKATNVNSCWYALEAMPDSRSTVLILGGTDKGNDYSEIEPLVRRKVKGIVAMGVDNAKIMNFFAGKVDSLADTHSLADAVEACRAMADKGDTVLLSPCCASFDLFENYEQRGRLFKEAVNALD